MMVQRTLFSLYCNKKRLTKQQMESQLLKIKMVTIESSIIKEEQAQYVADGYRARKTERKEIGGDSFLGQTRPAH